MWWNVDQLRAAVRRCEADIAADQERGIDTAGKERSLAIIKRWLEKAIEDIGGDADGRDEGCTR